MEMSIGFGTGFRREERSKFGQLIESFYDFLNSGKTPRTLCYCPFEEKEVPAVDFVIKSGRYWIVKPERLPADLDINALTSLGKKVMVESSEIDLQGLVEKLGKEGMKQEIRGKSVFYEGERIVNTRTQNIGKEIKNMRTVSTLLPKYQTPELGKAIEIIDTMYTNSLFNKDETAAENVVGEIQLKQEMRPELRMQLEAAQVPILSLRMEPWLTARRANFARILKMNNRELSAYLQTRR